MFWRKFDFFSKVSERSFPSFSKKFSAAFENCILHVQRYILREKQKNDEFFLNMRRIWAKIFGQVDQNCKLRVWKTFLAKIEKTVNWQISLVFPQKIFVTVVKTAFYVSRGSFEPWSCSRKSNKTPEKRVYVLRNCFSFVSYTLRRKITSFLFRPFSQSRSTLKEICELKK